MQAETKLSPAASSARVARRFVVATLGAWSCAHAAEVVCLLTNELVTNAVLHARSEIGLRISRDTQRLRVEVGDHSAQAPVRRRLDLGAQTGRGLALVDALAADWGVEQLVDNGKVVWFEVEAPVDATAGVAVG